jgi:hypothetical protein
VKFFGGRKKLGKNMDLRSAKCGFLESNNWSLFS